MHNDLDCRYLTRVCVLSHSFVCAILCCYSWSLGVSLYDVWRFQCDGQLSACAVAWNPGLCVSIFSFRYLFVDVVSLLVVQMLTHFLCVRSLYCRFSVSFTNPIDKTKAAKSLFTFKPGNTHSTVCCVHAFVCSLHVKTHMTCTQSFLAWWSKCVKIAFSFTTRLCLLSRIIWPSIRNSVTFSDRRSRKTLRCFLLARLPRWLAVWVYVACERARES